MNLVLQKLLVLSATISKSTWNRTQYTNYLKFYRYYGYRITININQAILIDDLPQGIQCKIFNIITGYMYITNMLHY